ncbi:MAG TPA: sugar phosphate isomerase/epimerase [Acidisoma sp.]|uniref:sugar phosphate isomerase/epimerase family protein n=1 Tax=Acidisoma sp. TaxID=1872115 RepID=UPI002B5DC438|nr:sugar phosphate isomerase/epimerase [Acidisoma sp.]HTI01881.1 sugar phosphate isomerase/epimerase [Acidisoma sp.]
MTPIITGVGTILHNQGGGPAALDGALTRAAAAGADHAELSATHLHITVAGRDNAARQEALAQVCARHGLTYTLHAPIAVNFMDTTHGALHLAVLESSLYFAGRIGATVTVIHPGRVSPQADLADRRRLLQIERDQVLRAADLAGKLGVRIGMENLNPNRDMMAGRLHSYALEPAALAEQVATIDHEAVCGVLDFGHGWLAAGRLGFDYHAQMRAFAPLVGHLHVTDNCGMPVTYPDANDDEHVAYGMGDLHLPIGWGTVPYETLLADLPIRPGSIANIEIKGSHDVELAASILATRGFAARLNGANA